MENMKKKTMRFNGNEIVFCDEPNKGVAGIAPDQPDELAEEMVSRWNQHCGGTGMYGETPRVQVGQFTICRQSDKSVWIENDDGEGAEFHDDLFEQAIKDFFDKHF
jgi:hypothetical protein